MLAAVYMVRILVETDNPDPYLRIVWDNPKTGKAAFTAILSLNDSHAEENNHTIFQLADQILNEHLEQVHKVQAICEKGMK